MPVIKRNIECTVAHELHAQALELALKRGGDVERTVGYRKHALAALYLERHAKTFKKVDGGMTVKAGKRGIQKPRVLRHVGEQLFASAVVRHVAASLAGDVYFFAKALIRIEQRYRSALTRSTDRGHHTACAAADHNDFLIHLRSCQKCRSAPRCAQVRRTLRKCPRPSCWQRPE